MTEQSSSFDNSYAPFAFAYLLSSCGKCQYMRNSLTGSSANADWSMHSSFPLGLLLLLHIFRFLLTSWHLLLLPGEIKSNAPVGYVAIAHGHDALTHEHDVLTKAFAPADVAPALSFFSDSSLLLITLASEQLEVLPSSLNTNKEQRSHGPHVHLSRCLPVFHLSDFHLTKGLASSPSATLLSYWHINVNLLCNLAA